MRKVKLQMQLTLNGLVAGPNGEMDFFTWNWGEDIKNYVKEITEPVDTIILGRKLAEGFIPHWTASQADPKTADLFAQKMVDLPKVVFSRTLTQSKWDNTTIALDPEIEIEQLKNKPGKDIIVYGGANLVSSLISQGLIDEYHLFINPVAVGNGLSIFGEVSSRLNLRLVRSQRFDCGIVVLNYSLS